MFEDLIKINAHNILVATGGKIEYDDSIAQLNKNVRAAVKRLKE